MPSTPESLYERATTLDVQGVRLCHVVLPALRAGPAPRALLLHGNPSHLDHWAPVVAHLRNATEVAAYDQPGFGRSGEWPNGVVCLERSADMAVAMLDQLGWREPVAVLGQSHGALVALAMAARAPHRVSKLALLGTGGAEAHFAYRALAVPGAAPVLELVGRALYGFTVLEPLARLATRLGARAAFVPDSVPPEVVAAELRDLARRPSILGEMVRLTHDDPCAKAARFAARVRAPVLFIHGESDALVPIGSARALYDCVAAHRQLIAVPGGHMVHYTRPHVVGPLLEAWLGQDARSAAQE